MNGANGKTGLALGRFVPAFERIVGRTPTEAENKEFLALADLVGSELDPSLLFVLADWRAKETCNRVPGQVREVMEQVLPQVQAAVVGAAQAGIAEAIGDAVQRLRAEGTSARDSERSRVVAASPPWWRDLAVYVAGLASVVGLAWFLVYLGPVFGRWGVLAAAASAMIFAGMVALWRETPAPASVRRIPVQQLASFIAGLVAYIAIAWLTARGRQLPLAALPAATAAAGVALGLLWRGRR